MVTLDFPDLEFPALADTAARAPVGLADTPGRVDFPGIAALVDSAVILVIQDRAFPVIVDIVVSQE